MDNSFQYVHSFLYLEENLALSYLLMGYAVQNIVFHEMPRLCEHSFPGTEWSQFICTAYLDNVNM